MQFATIGIHQPQLKPFDFLDVFLAHDVKHDGDGYLLQWPPLADNRDHNGLQGEIAGGFTCLGGCRGGLGRPPRQAEQQRQPR